MLPESAGNILVGGCARIEYTELDGQRLGLARGGMSVHSRYIVEDDVVKMYVEVAGSYSYNTQIGGQTTVPKVTVNMIEIFPCPSSPSAAGNSTGSSQPLSPAMADIDALL